MKYKKHRKSITVLSIFLALFLSFHTSLAIDITGCTELSQSYAIYNLTQDIIDSSASVCLNISANNVILDCGGHKVDGIDSSSSYGIKIYRSSQQTTNVTIKNCIVTDWTYGIYLYKSDGNKLENITSNSNWRGFHLYYSDSNTFTNITTNSNTQLGIYLWYSNSNTFTNIISNLNNDSGIVVEYSNFTTLTNITANSNNYGIEIYRSFSTTLTNITTNLNSLYGIYLLLSSTTTLTNITTQDNEIFDIVAGASSDTDCINYFQNVIGSNNLPILYYNYSVNLQDKVLSELILCNADNSYINNITIEASPTKKNNGLIVLRTDSSNFSNIISNENYYGIYLSSSNSNTLTNITANSNNYHGIYLSSSNSNTLTNSHISNNNQYGIYLYNAGSSGPNLIYNNFFNNTHNVYFDGTIYPNNWNTTKQEKTNIIGGNYLGGNFYAKPDGTGYSETCDDNNLDGICDSPYTLATNNTDYLPLTTLRIKNCTVITNPGEYILTQDIINSTNSTCIDIQANNVTLDCQGHKIDGIDSTDTYGIRIYRPSEQVTNITIRNCIVTDWNKGIYVYRADENKIENTIVSSNLLQGIYLYSYQTKLNNITAEGNKYGIYIWASPSNYITNATLKSNNFGIYLTSANYNKLINITSTNNVYGLYMEYSDYLDISNINSYQNGDWDIYYITSHSENDCHSSFQNVIGTGNKPILFFNTTTTIKNWNNNISEIILCHADNSTIDNLTLIGSGNNGLLITATYYTNITNSYFENLYSGIYFDHSDSNIITNSHILNNKNGLYFSYAGSSGPNLIYNNFLNNDINVGFKTGVYTKIYPNNWNTTKTSGTNIVNGPYLGGNFYAKPDGTGYSQTCTDSDKDGICDQALDLINMNSCTAGVDCGNNTDYLPLAVYQTSTPSTTTTQIILQKQGSYEMIYDNQTNDLSVTVYTTLTSCTVHTTVPKNEWTKISFTCCSNGLNLYKDSELVDHIPCPGNIVPSTGSLYIGGNSSGYSFHGIIDELHILNTSNFDPTRYFKLSFVARNPMNIALEGLEIMAKVSGKFYKKYENITIEPSSLVIPYIYLPKGVVSVLEVTPKSCPSTVSLKNVITCE